MKTKAQPTFRRSLLTTAVFLLALPWCGCFGRDSAVKPRAPDAVIRPAPPPPEPPAKAAPAPVEASVKAAPPPPKAFPETGPLPEQYRVVFRTVRPDPPPRKLVRNTHYYISNENAHHLWRETIANLGGALAGPGTDQLYMLAAWQRPSVLFAIDFDESIQYVHHLYGLAFGAADSPAEFLAIWRYNARTPSKLRTLIDSEVADPELRKKLTATLKSCNADVLLRFLQVQEHYRRRNQTCYLTDPAQYAIVRDLWRWGRVFPVRGDLTAELTMQDLARALDQARVPLRVLYLSNAEQYFPFSPAYRRNILVQPFDDRSIVLRTQYQLSDVYPDEQNYRYNRQGALNLVRWLRHSNVVNAKALMEQRTHSRVPGVSVIDREPQKDPTPPKIAPAAAGHSFPGRLPL